MRCLCNNSIISSRIDNFLATGALPHRHQPLLWGHDGADRSVHVVLKAQVSAGDDADQILPIHHRHAGNMVGPGQGQHLANGGGRRGYDGIVDDAALVFLDSTHFLGLFLDRHVLVDNTDTTFLSQGDGQPRFRDGIHRRR